MVPAHASCSILPRAAQELRAGTWLPVAASQAVIMDVLKGGCWGVGSIQFACAAHCSVRTSVFGCCCCCCFAWPAPMPPFLPHPPHH